MNNKNLIDKSSGISYEDIDSCVDAEQMVAWNEQLQLDICSLQNQIENAQGVEAENRINAKKQAARIKKTLSGIIENRLNFTPWKYE